MSLSLLWSTCFGCQAPYDYWLARSCYMHVHDGELTHSDEKVAAGSWSERAIMRARDDLPFLFGRVLFSAGRTVGLVDEALTLNNRDRLLVAASAPSPPPAPPAGMGTARRGAAATCCPTSPQLLQARQRDSSSSSFGGGAGGDGCHFKCGGRGEQLRSAQLLRGRQGGQAHGYRARCSAASHAGGNNQKAPKRNAARQGQGELSERPVRSGATR